MMAPKFGKHDARVRKEFLQGLFERMADEFHGTVELEEWHRDASATVRFGEDLAKLSWVRWLEGDLVRVQQVDGLGADWGPPVHVSPVPSAVIAVATR